MPGFKSVKAFKIKRDDQSFFVIFECYFNNIYLKKTKKVLNKIINRNKQF